MNIDREMGERLVKIGLNVAYYRKLKNLSQAELAEKSNLSRVQIGHLEAPNMFVNPTAGTLISIALALEIPVSKLFDFRDA